MSINAINVQPSLIQIEKLSTKDDKNKEPVKQYINPAFIVSMESSSKQKRLKEGFNMGSNSIANETKFTLSNGEEIHIEGSVDEVAEALNGTGIKTSKLNIVA